MFSTDLYESAGASSTKVWMELIVTACHKFSGTRRCKIKVYESSKLIKKNTRFKLEDGIPRKKEWLHITGWLRIFDYKKRLIPMRIIEEVLSEEKSIKT